MTISRETDQRVLVLGAYGLIGQGIVQHLLQRGFSVAGLGRNRREALRAFPDLTWHIQDISTLVDPDDWATILEGVDAVVNCSGALQDGPRDHLDLLHHNAVAALATACAARDIQVVQISAVGVSEASDSPFLSTKAQGDVAIQTSGARHVILRPALVIAPAAYGGTALLRMLAAIPWVQPIAMGSAPVQTIGLADLATSVDRCLTGAVPNGTVADLAAPDPLPLSEVVAQLRRWLGFAPARFTLPLPDWTLRPVSLVADVLGRLGWRSPLRSNALASLRQSILADSTAWEQAGQPALPSLALTLSAHPSRGEDRLSARLSLVLPLLIFGLALFWFLSGAIGIWQWRDAASVLTSVGWSLPLSALSVIGFALVDIALAIGLLWRSTAARACLGMIGVSLFYLLSASLFTPALWVDPLGPLVKVIPSILLAMVVHIGVSAR